MQPDFMKKVSARGLLAFFILAVAEIAALIVADCTHEAAAYSIARWMKPLLMPSLAIAVLHWIKRQEISLPSAGLVFCALAFHTIGDILLSFNGENFFVTGISAFFTGHIFYIVSLCRQLSRVKTSGKLGIIALTAAAAIAFMLPYRISGFLQVCAYIYGTALLSIVSFSLAGLMEGHRNAGLTLIGGVLFVISDSMIALSSFNSLHLPFHDSLIMITYIAAQFLIVISFRERHIASTIRVL